MKDYRRNELKWLSMLYIVTFFMLCTDAYSNLLVYINERNSEIIVSLVENVVISCLVPLVAFVIDCILSSNIKDKLISLFILPMSGETVFSKIKNGEFKDKRINETGLIAAFEDVLNDMPNLKGEKRLYENREWYKLYNKRRSDGAITQLQKDYLTCRDMFIHTVICFIAYLVLAIAFSGVSFSWTFICLFISLAVLINIGCHTKMKRFVYTVIVQEALDRQQKD